MAKRTSPMLWSRTTWSSSRCSASRRQSEAEPGCADAQPAVRRKLQEAALANLDGYRRRIDPRPSSALSGRVGRPREGRPRGGTRGRRRQPSGDVSRISTLFRKRALRAGRMSASPRSRAYGHCQVTEAGVPRIASGHFRPEGSQHRSGGRCVRRGVTIVVPNSVVSP